MAQDLPGVLRCEKTVRKATGLREGDGLDTKWCTLWVGSAWKSPVTSWWALLLSSVALVNFEAMGVFGSMAVGARPRDRENLTEFGRDPVCQFGVGFNIHV